MAFSPGKAQASKYGIGDQCSLLIWSRRFQKKNWFNYNDSVVEMNYNLLDQKTLIVNFDFMVPEQMCQKLWTKIHTYCTMVVAGESRIKLQPILTQVHVHVFHRLLDKSYINSLVLCFANNWIRKSNIHRL